MSFYQSEQCFRRYESAIASALGNYPNPIRFSSKRRSPSTDAARCKNAMRSYQEKQWATEYAIFTEFKNRPLRVWYDETHTIIGPAISEDIAEVLMDEAKSGHQALLVKDATDEDVANLIDILDRGVLGMPLEFDIKHKDTIDQEITGRFNVVARVETKTIIVF